MPGRQGSEQRPFGDMEERNAHPMTKSPGNHHTVLADSIEIDVLGCRIGLGRRRVLYPTAGDQDSFSSWSDPRRDDSTARALYHTCRVRPPDRFYLLY